MIYPVPKPAKRGPKERAPKELRKNREPMKRTRMKQVNRKRGGSSFPKQRDAKYRRWIWTENPCMLSGHVIYRRFSLHDVPPWQHPNPRALVHSCWGGNTPAHVGEHQAGGAPDFGVLVPLCEAAHRFYDNRRWLWRDATTYSEAMMASAAAGYALKYVERGGTPEPR